MNELADKVAIITGGGYGIGKQIALKYGAAGAKLVLAARSIDPMKQTCGELEKIGAKAIFVQTDVAKESDCKKMTDETLKAFGRVDILVNNAGISGPTKRITDMSLAEWQEVIDIDLTGAWLASRAVIPHMDKARDGNILMISSGAGRRGYPLRIAIRGGEMGDDWAYADAGRRMGSARHPRQLHLSGRDRRRSHRARDACARGIARAALRGGARGISIGRGVASDGDRGGSRARCVVPRDRGRATA